jgi:hypothetical protein
VIVEATVWKVPPESAAARTVAPFITRAARVSQVFVCEPDCQP